MATAQAQVTVFAFVQAPHRTDISIPAPRFRDFSLSPSGFSGLGIGTRLLMTTVDCAAWSRSSFRLHCRYRIMEPSRIRRFSRIRLALVLSCFPARARYRTRMNGTRTDRHSARAISWMAPPPPAGRVEGSTPLCAKSLLTLGSHDDSPRHPNRLAAVYARSCFGNEQGNVRMWPGRVHGFQTGGNRRLPRLQSHGERRYRVRNRAACGV